MALCQAVQECLVLGSHRSVGVLGPRQAAVSVLHLPLQHVETRLDRILQWLLHSWPRLRRRHWNFWRVRERVSVYEGMPRGPTLDLTQAHEIATLEIACAVLELPEWRVRRASVEHVGNYLDQHSLHPARTGIQHTFMEAIHIQLPHEGGYVGMLEVLPGVAVSFDVHDTAKTRRTLELLRTQTKET